MWQSQGPDLARIEYLYVGSRPLCTLKLKHIEFPGASKPSQIRAMAYSSWRQIPPGKTTQVPSKSSKSSKSTHTFPPHDQ